MTSPSLSVILATPDTYATIGRTVRRLNAQTEAGRVEVAFVVASREGFAVPEADVDRLHSFQVVEHVVVDHLSEARAAGVLAARGEFVAVGEDHSFPHADWAERLLAAHAQGHDIVGACLCNPEPANALGWADLIINFSGVTAPCESGLRMAVGGHNASYRRELLLSARDRLADIMQLEFLFHLEQSRRGKLAWLDGAALTDHHNITNARVYLSHKWLGGRLYGALRSRGWPAGKRLVVGMLACGAPVLRLWRMRGDFARLQRAHGCVPRAMPWMIAGLVVHAAGEVFGALLGEGDCRRHYWRGEFQRDGLARVAEAGAYTT